MVPIVPVTVLLSPSYGWGNRHFIIHERGLGNQRWKLQQAEVSRQHSFFPEKIFSGPAQ